MDDSTAVLMDVSWAEQKATLMVGWLAAWTDFYLAGHLEPYLVVWKVATWVDKMDEKKAGSKGCDLVGQLALLLVALMAVKWAAPMVDNLEPCWVVWKVSMWAALMDEKLAVSKGCDLVGQLALLLAVLMV